MLTTGLTGFDRHKEGNGGNKAVTGKSISISNEPLRMAS